MENRKYCVQLVEKRILDYNVEANGETEAINEALRLSRGLAEPDESHRTYLNVEDCYIVEPGENYHSLYSVSGEGTPLEDCALF